MPRHAPLWLALACAACAAADEPAIATHVDDWRDEVIYQIVVDRFDNGDPTNDVVDGIAPVPGDLARFQGGDWAGVTRRLGYLERLGVTTLWISPVVDNVQRTGYQDGYHGYWASSFIVPNRRFGELEELRALVASAHGRGMKVIVDLVVNHAGRVFFYDLDGDGAMGPGEAEPTFSDAGPYDAPLVWLTDPPEVYRAGPEGHLEVMALAAEHFHRRGQTTDGSPLQKELGDFPTGLRDLDTEHPELVAALVDTVVHWVELTDVDGFRLDAVPHAPPAFWSQFAAEVRARLAVLGKHRFLLLGEVFDGDPSRLAGYTGPGGLDSVFDFSLKGRVIDNFILDGFSAASVAPALAEYASYYPAAPHPAGIELSPWQARVSFADNHDVPRLRYWLDDPLAAELAMTVVFTVDAIPAVYYGTEQELDGGWGNASREVLWERGFAEDTRMYGHLARLAAIRRDSPALRRGSLRVAYASEVSARESGPGAGLLAWERYTAGDRVLIAVNAHPIDRAAATIRTGFASGTALRDELGGGTFEVGPGGDVTVEVAPRRALILAP
ncbi:MAG TPA: alpha-amylase family glycosyl hydrolase [Kofleriaceae bacterium]|nr:alpha-amylase family glycosyl hydrolase [Kofleriaceae bacterium]